MHSTILCVDCDGTLLRTDLLYEAVFKLLKESAFLIFLFPLWLMKGRAYFKEKLAQRVTIDASLLPYNESFLEFLRKEKSAGRELVLATASHRYFADAIANYLGIFARVISTENGINLSGRKKADYLCQIFGERMFDYAGNSRIDLQVWKRAAAAIVINSHPALRKEVSQVCPIAREFFTERFKIKTVIKEIRLHQWLKNILVFVPLVASHKFANIELICNALLAFFAYGACASSAYILNDLLDLSTDRAHPFKRLRPFASGDLPLCLGAWLAPVFLIAGLAISLFVSHQFLIILITYYATTIIYSVWLKKIVLIDVMVLAALYIFRIIAGTSATAIVPSFWLLVFSLFLFLSLSLIKRHSELLIVLKERKITAEGRGYSVDDLPLLLTMGSVSGYISVLVMALYINSPDVHKLYRNPEALWMIIPLLLYWISRTWLMSHRGYMHHDPVVFALKDRISLIIAGLTAAILGVSALGFSIG